MVSGGGDQRRESKGGWGSPILHGEVPAGGLQSSSTSALGSGTVASLAGSAALSLIKRGDEVTGQHLGL